MGPPHQNSQFSREMQHRLTIRQRDAVRRRQLVDADLRLSGLERPGKMMNVPYLRLPRTSRKQAVALRQEMIQRSRPAGAGDFAQSTIVRFEANAAAGQEALAAIVNRSISLDLPVHAGKKVRKMK